MRGPRLAAGQMDVHVPQAGDRVFSRRANDRGTSGQALLPSRTEPGDPVLLDEDRLGREHRPLLNVHDVDVDDGGESRCLVLRENGTDEQECKNWRESVDSALQLRSQIGPKSHGTLARKQLAYRIHL